MRLWAFGTSPHGLGLRPEVFWSLSGDELAALKEQHDAPLKRWAIQMAADYNRTYDTKGVPWIADDFLHPDGREVRIAASKKDQAAASRLAFELGRMKPGEDVDGLPDWARVN